MTDDNKADSPTPTPGSGGSQTTAVPETPTRTPGWYPAPDDTDSEIYWDGERFHGNREKDPSSSPSRWERFKKGFVRERWIAGTVVALLPFAGVVAGHWMSQHTAAEQAQRAFEQQQERDAYIGFYNTVDEFVEAVWAEIRLWEPADYPAGAPAKRLAAPMKENLGTSLNNVLTAESKVTFYGSQETQKAANDVVEQVGNVYRSLVGFEHANPEYPDLTADQAAKFVKTIHEITDVIRTKLQSAHLAFRRQARADLRLPQADDNVYNPLYNNLPRGALPAAAAPALPALSPAPAPPALSPAPASSEPPR
jgi:hypothetical protein